MKKKELKTDKTAANRYGLSLFVILFIISVAFISGCAERGQNAPAANSAVAPEKIERAEFAIEKMFCTSCAAGIEAMLKRTPGVVSAEASFERKEAIVEFNPAEISPEKLIEAIEKMGYEARVKS